MLGDQWGLAGVMTACKRRRGIFFPLHLGQTTSSSETSLWGCKIYLTYLRYLLWRYLELNQLGLAPFRVKEENLSDFRHAAKYLPVLELPICLFWLSKLIALRWKWVRNLLTICIPCLHHLQIAIWAQVHLNESF